MLLSATTLSCSSDTSRQGCPLTGLHIEMMERCYQNLGGDVKYHLQDVQV